MSFRETAKTSFSWSILIQLSTQILNFVVSVILARLLFPKDFGLIGIIGIFILIGRTLLDGGLASSLIRSKDVDETDYSTVFFTNLSAAIVLYVALFGAAPWIALFFDEPSLTNLLRMYGLVFIIGGFSIVQSVRLNKNLQFKLQFQLQIPSLLISACVAIWMAYTGYGVWSLVAKELVFTSLATIQLWYYAKWTPSWQIDVQKLKYHWNFGYKLLLTDILGKFFNDLYKVLISKLFTTAQLGLYTRAKSMEELPSSVVFNAINRVMYPLLANIQEDDARLKNIYRQIISTVTYFVVPLLCSMAVLAEPLFIFLLTDKWAEAVPYFQILVLAGLISPIQAYLVNICKVKGRSDLVLKIALIEYTLIVAGLIPAIWLGINGLLWSLVVVVLLKTILTARIAGNLIGYTLKEQWQDVYPPFVLSAISVAIVWGVHHYYLAAQIDSLFWQLAIATNIFFWVYALASHLANNLTYMLIRKGLLDKYKFYSK